MSERDSGCSVQGRASRVSGGSLRVGHSSSPASAWVVPPELRPLLVCPLDHGDLSDVEQTLVCSACGRVYPVEDGTPDMVVSGVD